MTIARAESADNTASEVNSSPIMLLGFTGEGWDRWLIISVALAALAAVAVGLATAGSIISHKRESEAAERELREYKTTVAKKVAEATSEGIKAGRSAADALARAAEANALATKFRLELEKYKSPRLLDNIAAAEMASAMQKFKGKRVSIGGAPATFESIAFAQQISAILTAAGLNAEISPGAAEVHLGVVRGVVARYVFGNEIGRNIAEALALELRKRDITASVRGDMYSEQMNDFVKQGLPAGDPSFEWVVVGVGDKF